MRPSHRASANGASPPLVSLLRLALALALAACSGDDPLTSREPLAPDLARPLAPAAGSPCALDATGVTTLERPMFPERRNSPTFGYSFKLYPGTDPSAATVIYLPGGPGQAGIDVERDEAYAPLGYALLQTDPRGVGCNAPESADDYPAEFYSSRYFADDVVAIVEQLALDNYILYGISYGTALATMVASRIEARGLPPPRALVLEGVLGTAFTSDKPGTEVAFEEGWRAVRDGLDESIRSQLTMEPLPLDLTPEQWGAGIMGLLPLGAIPETADMNFLATALTVLAPGVPEEQRSEVRDLLVEVGAPPVDEMGERLHHEITCHELAETDFISLSLEAGEIVANGLDCTDVALDEPFSAASWPVHSPIYYFSGTDDPNTPPWQARAHFDAETTAPRQLIHLERGGHNARASNLTDCAEPLWEAMATGSGFEAALATCVWPHELETALPAAAVP